MKKFIVAGLTLGLLAGCGSTDSKSEAKDNTAQSSTSETSNKKQVSILSLKMPHQLEKER